MADTIEHNAFIFWDPNGCFPGEDLGDAFKKVGGEVAYDHTYVYVHGLDFKVASEIARDWQADYIGPVGGASAEPRNLKDVTPKAIPRP